MNPSTTVANSRAVPTQATTTANSQGKFNATLINGLMKSGNGIVVKVPAGVKAIRLKQMTAPNSQSSVSLSKAEPLKVKLNNIARDNYITLRVDAEGKVHATVVEDLASSLELDQKLGKSSSKIGIIDGENRLLNENKSLRIRESIDGRFKSGNIRFLSASQLMNVSPRLSHFFKNFRSMTDATKLRHLSIYGKFTPILRRQKKEDQQHKGRRYPDAFGEIQSRRPSDQSNTAQSSIEPEKLTNALVRRALLQAKKKQSHLINDSRNPQLNRRAKQALQQRIERLERGIQLLHGEIHNQQEQREQKQLLVKLFIEEKQRLFQEHANNNKQKKAFTSQSTAKFSTDPEQIERSLMELGEIEDIALYYERKNERVEMQIRAVNNLIRRYGGHKILTPPPNADY